MSYELDLGWGGSIGDYVGFWGGAIKGYTTNLVQGSYKGDIFLGKFGAFKSTGTLRIQSVQGLRL